MNAFAAGWCLALTVAAALEGHNIWGVLISGVLGLLNLAIALEVI